MSSTTFDRLPEILVVEDIAEVLRLSATQVRRLLASGDLPGVRRGRRWYCRRDDLLAHLAPSAPAHDTDSPCVSCGAQTPDAAVGGSTHDRQRLCEPCAVALDLLRGPGGDDAGLKPSAPDQV